MFLISVVESPYCLKWWSPCISQFFYDSTLLCRQICWTCAIVSMSYKESDLLWQLTANHAKFLLFLLRRKKYEIHIICVEFFPLQIFKNSEVMCMPVKYHSAEKVWLGLTWNCKTELSRCMVMVVISISWWWYSMMVV